MEFHKNNGSQGAWTVVGLWILGSGGVWFIVGCHPTLEVLPAHPLVCTQPTNQPTNQPAQPSQPATSHVSNATVVTAGIVYMRKAKPFHTPWTMVSPSLLGPVITP